MKETQTEKYILTEAEAANFLCLSRATLRRARMEGIRANHCSSPPFIRLGRAIRYRRKDLIDWLDLHSVQINKNVENKSCEKNMRRE